MPVRGLLMVYIDLSRLSGDRRAARVGAEMREVRVSVHAAAGTESCRRGKAELESGSAWRAVEARASS
jgi:hypothetical protein